jgi:hypothetical protein
MHYCGMCFATQSNFMVMRNMILQFLCYNLVTNYYDQLPSHIYVRDILMVA